MKNDDGEFAAKAEEEDALTPTKMPSKSQYGFCGAVACRGRNFRRVLHTEATQEVMFKAGVGVALRTRFMLDASYNFRGVREGSSGETSLLAALLFAL